MHESGEPNPQSLFETAYPSDLREAERALLARKRHRPAAVVGVGLSGGGIRSATFCLGAIQCLAKQNLLGRIDYLSTVSGGGYCGAFLGRLFARTVNGRRLTADEVAQHLDPVAQIDLPGTSSGVILRWLRENGRYLAPKGAGDLLLGGAVLVRNLISVHVVLFIVTLAFWLALEIFRDLTLLALAGTDEDWLEKLLGSLQAPDSFLGSSSPLFLLALAYIVVFVVPAGTGYWTLIFAGRDTEPIKTADRLVAARLFAYLVGVILLVSVGMVWVLPRLATYPFSRLIWIVVLALAAVVALALLFSLLATRQARSAWINSGGESAGNERIFRDSYARHWISDRLKTGMQVALAMLVIALVDSIGQGFYVLLTVRDMPPELLAALSPLLALGAAARRLLVTFGGQTSDRRLSIPLGIAAQLAAGLIVLILLSAVSLLAHAIVWGFEPPSATFTWPNVRFTEDTAVATVGILVISLLLTILFGRQRSFINSSTHQPLYSARLVRAYLGASNFSRHRPSKSMSDRAVTEVVQDDDIAQDEYWPWRNIPPDRWLHAPLHLVNVTINETCDGRSQVQQQDRKGTSMAIGPCGFSVGVRHHLVYHSGQERVHPAGGYQVFARNAQPEVKPLFNREELSLGEWTGISGAAFSTGLGSRTNLGLSLLTGLANIRLGYWWDSGIERREVKRDLQPSATPRHTDDVPAHGSEPRKEGTVAPAFMKLVGNLLRRILPVHAQFFDELTARFHGTAHRHWYLSDGGHFENLGGYELIRRRLKTIILLDAEADPDFTFDGLAGLVRKARIDFGAEIRFLDEDELDALLSKETRGCIGSLAELRRGRWGTEPFDEPNLKVKKRLRQTLDPLDRSRYSRANAALASVCYDGSIEAGSWLLYIKATMTGDEPADLIEYHGDHSDFPHETTSDQFFDEAQWESYRRLGQHIAEKLLAGPQAGAGPSPQGLSVINLLGL